MDFYQDLFRKLKKAHPDAHCALNFQGPLQLLIATILSAQCTDERINQVTPALFQKYRTSADFARAAPGELERLIHSTGFYRNKAKAIRECCKILLEKHGGEVPRTLEELVRLPGVGRKTANVVLGHAYGIPGITTDTHVIRLSQRLGLSRHKDPAKVEMDLQKIIPQKEWTKMCSVLIFHGRRICFARKPDCPKCPVRDLCPYEPKTT